MNEIIIFMFYMPFSALFHAPANYNIIMISVFEHLSIDSRRLFAAAIRFLKNNSIASGAGRKFSLQMPSKHSENIVKHIKLIT